jgi:cation:H+ antiporter
MTPYLVPSLYVLAGVTLLFASGEQLVSHAAHLARSYRVPKAVIGAVVLGFGTSLPELFVSITDVVTDDPGIAVGNVVGSNIANTGLILGLGAVLAGFVMEERIVRVDLPLGLLAAVFLWIFCSQTEEVNRIAAAILLGAFALYLWGSYRHTAGSREHEEPPLRLTRRPLRDLLWVLAGLVGIAVAAELLVTGAERIARLLEVSELLIGLTVVALGTSLPELATLLAAIRRGEGALAVGNVAGSNIFNLLFVLGIASSVRPIAVEPVMMTRDFPALTVFSVLAFPILGRTRRIGRMQGVVLLSAFVGYWVWRATA